MSLENAVGLCVEQHYKYSWRDVILYNLSIGAGPEEIGFIYEKELKAVPTFAVMPCTATFGTEPYSFLPSTPTNLIENLRRDGTLHMEHELIIHKNIPIDGSFKISKRISQVFDRGEGKGAKIVIDVDAVGDDGELYFTNRMSYLNRWAGGYGGEKPPKVASPIPETEPSLRLKGSFAETAPWLYRLNGDTYQLHADPEIAKGAGFERPIIHGLCSLGYACRMMVEAIMPGQSERIKYLGVQFRSIALPGDEFEIDLWQLDEHQAAFNMVKLSDGKKILDAGKLAWE